MPKHSDKKPSCSCGSGKRFMQCCYEGKMTVKDTLCGHPESSQNVTDFVDILQSRVGVDLKIIDISNNLKLSNYIQHQKKYMSAKTIMVAEKNEKNAEVFVGRVRPDDEVSDFIVMYHGAYRTFEFDKVDSYINSIEDWICT